MTPEQIADKLLPLPPSFYARVYAVGVNLLEAGDWQVEIVRVEGDKEIVARWYVSNCDLPFLSAVRDKLMTRHWRRLRSLPATRQEWQALFEMMLPYSQMEELNRVKSTPPNHIDGH